MQLQLIKQLFEHVTAKGIHTIRNAASKDYAAILAQFDNLEGQNLKACIDREHRLVCCKYCGELGLLIVQRSSGDLSAGGIR